MALRLSDLVTGGELINTRKNCVHGYIQLQGLKRPLVLQLTGNCAADLAGRHIRFEVRARAQDRERGSANPDENQREGECNCDDDCENEKALLARLDLSSLAWEQIGPTGTMTAARKVRVTDWPPVERAGRCQTDESPPTWKRCLYLEWFSQNGRVVVELVDPVIEIVEPEASPGAGEQAGPLSEPWGDDPDEPAEGTLGITEIELDADGQAVIHDETMLPDGFEDSETAEQEPDSYGLIPSSLQRQLEEQARAIDRALHQDDEGAEFIREMELMDDLIEQGEGEPVGTLFDGIVRLPAPDQLDEQEAEQELKVLLARLALYGVALDMCEHFTAAAAYRLMVEQICREETAYAELRGTQWVQHFSTSDFCPECQAEFEQG